ncbi:12665_t:CDS:2, partial [Ambispora leptoticha]
SVVMEALDSTVFLVSEGIVYHMIHTRHKNQQEEYKRKWRPERSVYHSPEASETDEENPSGERKVVIKDLKWRSTT